MIRAYRRDLAVASAGLAAAVILALHWTHPGAVVVGPWISDPLNAIAKQIAAWNTYDSSGSVSLAYASWPYAAVLGIACAAFGSSAGQMLVTGLALGAGWVGAYAALRLLRCSPIAASLGAAVYLVNPWTAAIAAHGPALQWCFACAAAIAAIVAAAARFVPYRPALLAACVLTFAVPASVAAAGDWFSAAALAFAFVAAGAAALPYRSDGFAGWLAATALWSFAGAFWWIAASAFGASGAAPQEASALWLTLAIVAAFACAIAYDGLRARSLPLGTGLACVVAAAALFSGRALFTGVFAEATLSEPSPYASIPAYWYDAARWLNERPGDGAVLVLPVDSSSGSASYGWGSQEKDRLANDAIARRTVRIGPAESARSSQDAAIGDLVERVLANPSLDFATALHVAGIRYVLFRGDLAQGAGASLSLEELRSRLPSASATAFGPLAVLDTGPAAAEVESGSAGIAGEYKELPSGLVLNAALEDALRVDVSQLGNRTPQTPPLAYEASAATLGVSFSGSAAAGAAVAGAPLRVLWSSPLWWTTSHGFREALQGGAPVSLKIRMAASPSVRFDLTLTSAMLASPQPSAGRPLLSSIYSSVSPKHLGWIVVDPSNDGVFADVDVAVQPSHDTAYLLTQGGKTYRDEISAATGVVWATFHRVPLAPGINELGLEAAPARGTTRAASAAIAQPATLQATVDSTFPLPRDTAISHLRYAAVPLGVTLDRSPVVTLGYDAPSLPVRLGALLDLEVAGTPYYCFAPVGSLVSLDLRGAAIGCLRMAGIAPTRSLLAQTRVDAVDLDSLLPPHTIAAAATPAIHSVVAAWNRAGVDVGALPSLTITAQGMTERTFSRPDLYYAVLGSTVPRAHDDLTGAYYFFTTRGEAVSGVVIAEDARTYYVRDDVGTTQAVSKAQVVDVRYRPSRATITLAFDPRALAPDDGVGFRESTYPLDGAWIGHVGADGRFVADSNVDWAFDARTTNGFSVRSADLRRIVGTGGLAAVRFGFGLPDRRDYYHLTIAARVTPARSPGVRVTVGPQVLAFTGDADARMPANRGGATLVQVDDLADRTLAGAVGAPVRAAAPLPARAGGLFPLAGAVEANGAYVRLLQAYSGSWLAACLGSCRLLPQHVRDESGWNVWFTGGTGTLLLANAYVLAQAATLLVSLAAVALTLRGVRRRTPA